MLSERILPPGLLAKADTLASVPSESGHPVLASCFLTPQAWEPGEDALAGVEGTEARVVWDEWCRMVSLFGTVEGVHSGITDLCWE